MRIEFEATFIKINKKELRKRLKMIGAELVQKERLMRRVVFYPIKKDDDGWLRVRDEGNKITISYKRFVGMAKRNKVNKIDDQQELCLEVNDFEEGVGLMKVLGAKQKSYQETLREDWIYNGVEISIDTWPGLNPFVEIEAKNEQKVKMVSKKLGFDYRQAIFAPVHAVYEKELGIPPDVINNKTLMITFEKPPKKN